jgi:YrbI family 3-deoxy-D-manno-octulosonate 8-phosphate phosphatase
MRWVAFIPLHGNSKSNVNCAIGVDGLRRIAGRPLFAWCLEEAIASGCFDAIYLTADSPAEIRKEVADEFPSADKSVEVLDHAAVQGDVSMDSALLEFQQRIPSDVPFDVACLIQAASPLTRAEDFRAAKRKFLSENLDSLVTAVQSKRFFWTRAGVPVDYDPARRPAPEDREGYLVENGAFYLTSAKLLADHHYRLGGHIGIHEMPAETAIEITDEAGWMVMEQLLLKQKLASAKARASRIKVLVLDVDGTLTDAGMYYGPAGEALKKFNTRDAHGLQLLRENGISVCVISTEDSPAVAARMKKLRIDEYYPGIQKKLPLLLQLAKRWDIPLQNIGYVGDDLSDLECLSRVGGAFCPADAVSEILRQAHYVCGRAGGQGAVREVCDLILRSREITGYRSAQAEACS